MLLSSPNRAADGSSGHNGLLKVHIPPPPSAASFSSAAYSSSSRGGIHSAGAGASSNFGGGFPTPMTPTGSLSGLLMSSSNNGGGGGGTSTAATSPSPRMREEWFSLEGPMYMKSLGGALSMLQPRKRLYFGLEELENKLVFYRTKADFDSRKDCLGQISMVGALCSLVEGNLRAFLLHTEAGKKYLFEADNERAVDCWLNALQQRRDGGGAVQREHNNGQQNGGDRREQQQAAAPGPLLAGDRRHRSRSKSVGLSDSDSDLLAIKGAAGMQRQRARSHYYQQQQQQQPQQRRHQTASSLRLPVSPHSNALISPTQLESMAFSTPSTPVSMAATENGGGGLSRRKYSRVALRKGGGGSSSAITTKLGTAESSSSCCCVCGAAAALIGGQQQQQQHQGMLDSWLWDQQRHSGGAELLLLGSRSDCRSVTIDERGGVDHCDRNGGAISEGAEADLDSPGSPLAPPLPLLLNGGPLKGAESQSTVSSSETCESAGALAADQQRGREDELMLLRKLSNRQKEQIAELRAELDRNKKQQQQGGNIECPAIADDQSSSAAAFVAKSRFLNAELMRVNERKHEADKQIETYKRKISQLEAEMEEFKKEYVHLLQSCVRIPLRENSACDVVQVKLYGGDEHERRVKKLLERARESDPTLPSFEGITGRDCFHVDEYGFRHNFEGDLPLALHFVATQLHEHYQAQSADYVQLKHRWRTLLDAQPDHIERNRETRQLCRLGIPRSLRSKVWRLLIADQVADLKERYGPYYYRDLCSAQGTPAEKHYSTAHQKQVNLDLLRTMPGNVHFMSASCKGVTHLQSVLRAYCLHNPSIGYCQGMNFLVATALLFMSPEDAFWFLVAITQRYFDASYFDQSLTGAQADQEVLKEIVEQKFPRLAQHLDECEIDLTTVTLNWFIALFFDAVPFQTMLRIWDCFLMEGPKVLFRFTIALLGLYEEDILAHTDTISVIKVLKAGVRLALDVDGLIKYAFQDLNPFPSKSYLRQRQGQYLKVLQERLQKRHQLRQFLNVASPIPQSDQLCDLPIEVVVFSPFVPGRGYVCAGNQKRGKISMIQLHKEAVNLNTMDLEFDCRPVSMVIFQPEMAFVSLLSGYIMAVHLRPSGQAQILWELKLNDVALKLVHCSSRLYSCLANGTLAVLENAFERMPSALDLYHIPIAAAPITDALLDGENLYLAVACKIVVLHRQTLSTVASIYVASAAAGSQVPMFEKIRSLANSPHGIWLITAHSSLLQLWRDGQCEMLFDIRYDHSHRKPSFDEHDDQLDQVEVCSIFFHADELWVGTVDGYLMLYRVHLASSGDPGSAKCRPVGGSSKYQPGKRLSPAHGLAQPVPANRQQTYYIPTESEARVEEQNSSMENMVDGPERQASRKISVKIDQGSRKYSVNVHTIRRPSTDSATNSLISNGPASRLASSSNCSEQQQPPTNTKNLPPAVTISPGKRTLCTQQSIDSALSSLFDAGSSRTATQRPPTADGGGSPNDGGGASSDLMDQEEEADADFLQEICSGDEEEEADGIADGSSGQSEQAEEQRRRRFPSRLVRINSWRRLSQSVDVGKSTKPMAIPSRRNGGNELCRNFSCSAGASMGGPIDEVRIRRKDLDFDEPLLLAVKEGEPLPPSLGASPPTRRSSIGKLVENSQQQQKAAATDGGSESDLDVVETTVETIKSAFGMALQMKLKVADKPLRCIAVGQFADQDVVLTGAGEYGDEEALLRWRRDPNSGLWINDPLVDIGARGRKRTGMSSPSIKK